MSGDDGMDSTLEYILSDTCGFLLLHPFVSGDVYPLWGAPRHVWPRARVSTPDHWERREGQIGGEIPSACTNCKLEKWWRGSFLRLVLFRLVAPPLQPGVVGPFPGTVCLVPRPFATRWNLSYLEFLTITGGPRYSGYITPTSLIKINMREDSSS
jgi:hypothetical protein